MQRRIDFASERARYRQLADILRAYITSGEWEPDRSLPSEAALGHEYQVSQATVRRALAVLRAEGYVESVRGMPWRVRERGETTVVALQPGDRVRARVATRDDQDRHGVPEGVPVLVVSSPGRPDRVFRADEVEGEVPNPGVTGAGVFRCQGAGAGAEGSPAGAHGRNSHTVSDRWQGSETRNLSPGPTGRPGTACGNISGSPDTANARAPEWTNPPGACSAREP